MVRVSASMIVRNEEARLGRAIQSLRSIPAITEVVVLDTGSSDRTVEIARKLGAIVHEEPWQHDFAWHRNRCMRLCSNDWVFILDGDEEVVDAGDLERLFESPSEDGVTVWVECLVDGVARERFKAVRAFNRAGARWRYPVHNQLVGVTKSASSAAVIHAHYDPAKHTQESKRRRVSVLLNYARMHHDDPEPVYFLAKDYRALKEPEKVLRWGRQFLEMAPSSPHTASVYCWLVEAEMATSGIASAQAVLERALREHPSFQDLCHWDLTFSALRWMRAVNAQRELTGYSTLAQRAATPVSSAMQAFELLGLPIRFRGPTTA